MFDGAQVTLGSPLRASRAEATDEGSRITTSPEALLSVLRALLSGERADTTTMSHMMCGYKINIHQQPRELGCARTYVQSFMAPRAPKKEEEESIL
jgi:hypothetical protein